MSDTRVWTLRTIARTPWGFMAYAATTLDEVNPVTMEEARKDNLRVLRDRLVPSASLPGLTPPTPVADTTIAVNEKLVSQDLMTGEDDHIERFTEYEIEYWKMAG